MSGQNVDPGANPNPTPPVTLPSDQPPKDGEKLFAGKYKTVEELEKGYLEAQKLIGKKTGDPAPPPAQPTPPKPGTVPGVPDAPAVPPLAEFEKEFAETGKLSDESFKKLEGMGFPKTMVDAYIKGLQASVQENQTAVFNAVGGEQQYAAMIQWAAAHLTPAEKTAYNNVTVNGDVESVKLAAQGLMAKYQAAVGTNPNLVKGTDPGSSGGGYESVEQMKADMRDPRYAKDPAYREAVKQKIGRSKNI